MTISVEAIEKSFGDFQLGPVSFECDAHTILGLVGKNGAGKTTLLRAMYGLYPKGQKSVRLDGQAFDPTSSACRQRMVYQPEENSMPLFLSPDSIGKLLRRFYARWSAEEYARLLAAFGVPATKTVRNLSSGNRRKLAVAAALATQPDVALLDEPTSNVDPISRDGILNELAEYRRRKPVAIIFSSHILSDVCRVANALLVLNVGAVAYFGDVPAGGTARETEEHILATMR